MSTGDVEKVASELVERVLAKVLREETMRAEQEKKGEGEGEGEKVCICSIYVFNRERSPNLTLFTCTNKPHCYVS